MSRERDSSGRHAYPLDMRLVRFAGYEAIAASLVLLTVVLAREVGLNPVNGWTIVLGFVAGVTFTKSRSQRVVVVAWLAVALAAVPALIGGLGLLFLPALLLVPLE